MFTKKVIIAQKISIEENVLIVRKCPYSTKVFKTLKFKHEKTELNFSSFEY